jgi:hypothetical protein
MGSWRKVRSIVVTKNEWIKNLALLAALQDRNTEDRLKSEPSGDVNYSILEKRFLGSRENIIRMEPASIRFFEGCNDVLDIGCGGSS